MRWSIPRRHRSWHHGARRSGQGQLERAEAVKLQQHHGQRMCIRGHQPQVREMVAARVERERLRVRLRDNTNPVTVVFEGAQSWQSEVEDSLRLCLSRAVLKDKFGNATRQPLRCLQGRDKQGRRRDSVTLKLCADLRKGSGTGSDSPEQVLRAASLPCSGDESATGERAAGEFIFRCPKPVPSGVFSNGVYDVVHKLLR